MFTAAQVIRQWQESQARLAQAARGNWKPHVETTEEVQGDRQPQGGLRAHKQEIREARYGTDS